MSKYRILSLDGGGIRGVLTAVLLERLEITQPGFLDQIDLFAGTSTGGLLALGLASGLSPTEMRELYEMHGHEVFTDSFLDNIRNLGTLIGADYSLKPLKRILEERFGSLTIGELPKKVLVSSFDLDNQASDPRQRTWKAKFFHNYPGEDSDGGENVVDLAIRTSAAPTYFPIYQGYIDGGVVGPNPSVSALTQALHPETGGQDLDDIVLLSMGTGHNPRYITSMDGDWGLVHWAPHIIDLVLEGSANLADYQCQQILGKRYWRVNVLLPDPIGLDGVDRIPTLKRIARQYDLHAAVSWLTQYYV